MRWLSSADFPQVLALISG
jgi:hypothetical protein